MSSARTAAAGAAFASLAPLLAAYHGGVDEVLASQEALQGRLQALLDGARWVVVGSCDVAACVTRDARGCLLSQPPHSPPRLAADLKAAEAKESSDPNAALGVHARRVEALRKRLEGIAYTMARVQLRLDGLTQVVTKAEDKKRKERNLAAVAP